MRADRLLSILLLLQTHGKMSAGKLSDELEVSERTIYRDIDALNTAGIPIYGEPGPDGGYALLDNYRTHLTGLTEKEISALFMLSVPEPLIELGIGQELKTALLKLSAALPEKQIYTEKYVRQRFHLDSMWWQQAGEPVPHLRAIQKAVLEDKKLYIKFKLQFPGEIEQLVDPYGLVAKAGTWYLVYSIHGSFRVHQVHSLLEVHISEESFNRNEDFSLVAFWEAWCTEQEVQMSSYNVLVRIIPEYLPLIRRHFGDRTSERITSAGPPDTGGRITVELPFESFEAARARILGFGKGVEVLEPLALRRSVLDYAEQICKLYGD